MDYKQFVEITRVSGRWAVRLKIDHQRFTVIKTPNGDIAEWYAEQLTKALTRFAEKAKV